ncbi:MAG: SIR2 family protein [Verrucomicrobia bacterium]|nr:SIR2 family protein [Verrucomicrobiota bacterium]
MRQVAALGQLANPIVSFNIESFTSTILARPAGPARIIPFIKPQTRRIEFNEFGEIFQRIVYHPHGLSTADCIITEKDYETLNGTLAFELAVHSAFGNNLAIVGISLQDEYLREQIHKFRRQIDSIT